MTKMKFIQSLSFADNGGFDLKKSFSPGIHEVPEEIMQHPFFIKCMEAGLIIDIDGMGLIAESNDERIARMAKVIDQRAQAKLEAAKALIKEDSLVEGVDGSLESEPENETQESEFLAEDESQEQSQAESKSKSKSKSKR